MTEHNNSNADGERPNPTPNNGDPGSADFDAAWAQFAAEHAEDLNDVERSRNAKRFEKHAQRKEKEALLSVDDLDPAAFAGGAGRGPRDFTGSSWLDTDDVMDCYGDPFTPPNPDLGPVNKSKLVFWILLIVGVIGVCFSRYFLIAMDVPQDSVLPLSTTYLQIYFAGMPFNLLYNFGSSLCRARGDSRTPLFFLCAAGVSNVGLNIFFVAVCRMDVAGVALGTIIAQLISSTLVLTHLCRLKGHCHVNLRKLRIYKDALGDIVRIGDDSSRLLQVIQDWSLNDFSNSEKIDTLKLGDVLTIVTDEEAAASEGTKTASPNILQALADVSVGDMSDAINGLSVEQILGADAVEDDPLLQQLRSSTLGSLAEDIRQMTIQELFADSVYEYHETDSFAASTGDTPHRDDFAALQALYEQYTPVYGRSYLYVKQNNAYVLAADFLAQYAADNADVPAGEDFGGTVPNVLYSPYLQVEADDANYAGAPLYYLREVSEAGEGDETVITYKMTVASRVTGWSLPENALPDGLDESMLYVRARGADGSFKKDADGNYVYEKAAKTDGFYTESTLYYWFGQADSVKSIALTPARYELPEEFKDGRALFSRLVYAGTVGDVGALYERNELYTFDVTVQAFERAPLTNVYVNAEAPNDGNLYYCGTNGGIYRVGDLPQDGVLAPAAGVSSLLAAYFDADGKVYYYNEEGELTEAGGGSAADVSVSVRYTLDRSAETVPATGTKLYAYGNVSGLWRYLLRDEDGALRGYTLQNVGSIVKNMSANVKTATLRELYEDGLITIKAPSGTTVQAVLDFEIPAVVPTYSGQKLGDLTIGQMVLLMYALLQTP